MKAEYVDHMGDDLRVVNAARVSFNKESEWRICEAVLQDTDANLIAYLAEHNHWTPFSHCMITMREKVPIFVARQRFKHMVGFTYNEVSRRYVDDAPEFYQPEVWRGRPTNGMKQGSSDVEMNFIEVQEDEHTYRGYDLPTDVGQLYLDSLEMYNDMITAGVAPEQARMILPQAMYTEYYVTGSLSAWARAYKLRIDKHAQKEIQELAGQWGEIIEPLFPVSWKELVK